MSERHDPSATHRRWSLSVRTRIVAVITFVTALCLLAVGFSVAFVERHRILENIDQRLAANLESARFIVSEGDPDGGSWASSAAALAAVVTRMSPDDHTGAAGLHDGVVTIVPGVELDLDLRSAPRFAAYIQTLPRHEPVVGTYAAEGEVWRYLAMPITVAGSPPPESMTFVLAYDLNAELAELDDASVMFVIASALALIVVAAVSTAVATRLLRPLRRMRETAERISAESLGERLPIVGDDDVAELTGTINDMLDRLDSAVDAQRRLLSDVGHELKTPLTIVRGNIELMDASRAEEVRETRVLVLDELDRMTRLVQGLGEASALYGRQPLRPESVDLSDFIEQVVRKAAGLEGAEIMVGATAAGTAVFDPARITQAMLQLVQNAVTHGGGRLELGCTREGARIDFWVRDHGPGVADEAKTAIFERFHRERDAYGREGSGLGLSIVSMIAEAHRGSVAVEDAPGGGARFVLSIPSSPTTEKGGADGLDPHR